MGEIGEPVTDVENPQPYIFNRTLLRSRKGVLYIEENKQQNISY